MFVSVEGKLIYYEIHGAGEPVLFLNGILMSTVNWAICVEPLLKRYKVIFMDFFCQGRSEMLTEKFGINLQAKAVKELLDHLNLDKVHMVAASYGAMVALQFAVSHQERLKSLLIQGVRSHNDAHAAALFKSWIDVAALNEPDKLWEMIIPLAYSPSFYIKYEEFINERKKIFYDTVSASEDWFKGFRLLVNSCLGFNVRDKIRMIKVPTLILGGELDGLVPLQYHEEVNNQIEGSAYLIVKGAAHCPYVEKQMEFLVIVIGFIESNSE